MGSKTRQKDRRANPWALVISYTVQKNKKGLLNYKISYSAQPLAAEPELLLYNFLLGNNNRVCFQCYSAKRERSAMSKPTRLKQRNASDKPTRGDYEMTSRRTSCALFCSFCSVSRPQSAQRPVRAGNFKLLHCSSHACPSHDDDRGTRYNFSLTECILRQSHFLKTRQKLNVLIRKERTQRRNKEEYIKGKGSAYLSCSSCQSTGRLVDCYNIFFFFIHFLFRFWYINYACLLFVITTDYLLDVT